MPYQTSCCLVKPDAYGRHREIRKNLEDAGFRVVRVRSARLNSGQSHRLFHYKYGRPGFNELIEHIMSGMCYAMELSYSRALATSEEEKESGLSVRKLIEAAGPDDPVQARKSHKNSLRALFGKTPFENAVEVSPNLVVARNQNDVMFRVRRMTAVVFGAPASGKGTQCALLEQAYNMVQVSTGDIIRERLKTSPTIMKMVAAGELIPDEMVFGLVRQRTSEADCQVRGFQLDGYPRTAQQVQFMFKGTTTAVPGGFSYTELEPVSHIIILAVPDEVLIQRVAHRCVDPSTGKTYHWIYNPPPAGIASRCIRRADDNPDTLRRRLGTFNSVIPNVLNEFQDQLHAEHNEPRRIPNLYVISDPNIKREVILAKKCAQATEQAAIATSNTAAAFSSSSRSSSSPSSSSSAASPSNSAWNDSFSKILSEEERKQIQANTSEAIWRVFHAIIDHIDSEARLPLNAEPDHTAQRGRRLEAIQRRNRLKSNL